MDIAKAYVGAFIVGGVAAAVLAGAFMTTIAPVNQDLVLAAALAAGLVSGVATAAIPLFRNWIARAINVMDW
ncbi:MAG: hypothetical protein R3C46_06840 [Hyphomonadaceae bacterium]